MSGNPQTAPWIDLTEPIDTGRDYLKALVPTSLEPVQGEGDGRPHVSRLTTSTHSGTHVDAPRHFYADGLTIDQIPLERFHGVACVKQLVVGELHAITSEDIASAPPALHRGQMLFLSTGWDLQRGKPAFERHPYLTVEAAQWMVDQGVTVLGMDVITPEVAIEARQMGHKLDVHPVLLAADVLVFEQLRLSEVAGQHLEVFAFPLALVGADGSPVRVIGRVLADG